MTPEAIKAIETVLTEAIKILGPAIITGFVAYKTAKYQMKSKLEETDKRNELEARKIVYNLLIQEREILSTTYHNSKAELASVLSMPSEIDDDDDELISTAISLANTYLTSIQRALKSIKEYFEKNNLEDKDQYIWVQDCIKKVNLIQPANNLKTLKDNSIADRKSVV